LVVLGQTHQVVDEVLQVVFSAVVLSLQSESTVLCSLVLQPSFCVSLRQVKLSESIAVLHLIMVVSSFIKEPKRLAPTFVRPIMVHVFPGSRFEGLIELGSLGKTTQSLFYILPVDVAEAQHVVDDEEVLIEADSVGGREGGELGEGSLVAADGIAKLLDVIVEFAEDTVGDEGVGVGAGEYVLEDLDGLVLAHEGRLLWCRCLG
jgi:hypothetical protein